MSKREFKFAETLNVHKVDPSFIDKSFYASAIDSDVIESLDYYTSRISNNPQTSNKVILEENLRFRQAGKTTGRHNTDMNEISMLEGKVDVVSKNTGNRSEMSQGDCVSFSKTIDQIVDEILTHNGKQRTNLLKAFAFYLVNCGLDNWVKNPNLTKFVKELRLETDSLYFKKMVEYIGTRSSATSARNKIREIVEKYLPQA